MKKKLIIVESPAKCKKIEKFLGNSYKCIGSFGHLTELQKLDQINYNDFSVKYSNILSKKDQIEKIKTEFKICHEVIIATDDDREGEAIGWHICNLLKINPNTTKRILFNEITENALKNAINNPTTLNIDLINSQKARQVLDLLVGYKITPLLWKTFVSNTKNALSAGRCQTPALNIIYDNYKELENNNGEKGYKINGYFTNRSICFSLDNKYNNETQIDNFLELSKTFNHKFEKCDSKNQEKIPPEPFTTSILQQQVNNNFGYSPKETMSICQKLYEEGLITYMRTDSKTYSKDFVDIVEKYIIKMYDENYYNNNNKYYKLENISQKIDNINNNENNKQDNKQDNEKKVKQQEAHEAIRPTNIITSELDNGKWSPREINVYKLIWKNSLQSLMTNYKYLLMKCKISAPDDLYYIYNSELPIFYGFKILDINKKIEDEQKKIHNYLISLKETILKYQTIQIDECLTGFKQHYNEAKLVSILEKKGIGRPSTFSSLVEKIQTRGYVKRENIKGKTIKCKNYKMTDDKIKITEKEKEFGNEKNKLVIQPIGIMIIEYLKNNFSQIFNYEYTKNMEDGLDRIANRDESYFNLLNKCNNELDNLIKSINVKKIQFKIDKEHTYLISKNGPVIKKVFDNITEFLPVKSHINIDYLENNNTQIVLEDIIDYEKADEIERENKKNKIGIYKSKEILLKKGKFGSYLEYDGKNYSLPKPSKYSKNKSDVKNYSYGITLEEAIIIINNLNNNIVRTINNDISLRTGSYGYYIMLKTKIMKKPQFYSLKDCELNIDLCENSSIINWTNDKYKLDLKI